MKKTLSVLCVALVLLSCALVLPASAAVTPAVRMDGPVQAYTGDEIGVAMYVQGSIGGVQGTITYDPLKLEYVSATLNQDMIALGNTEDVTVKADSSGTVKFVCLSNVDGGDAPKDAWLTLNFNVLMSGAGTSTSVVLSEVSASSMSGTSSVAVENANTTVTVVDSSKLAVAMQGASIKTSTSNQGIRFETWATSAFDASLIEEAGVLMFPTALLYDGQDLELDTVGKGGTTPARARVTDAAELAKIPTEKMFATLTASTTGTRGNVAITARAYVKMTDGTVYYYSHNDSDSPEVNTGHASRSVVSVAQAIAQEEIAGAAKQSVVISVNGLESKAEALTEEEVKTLIQFCIDNYQYRNQ